MKIFRHSKKADLNLSVQAIVILIFAVIMLGLGLGLINFIFSSATKKIGGALDITKLSTPPTSDNPLTLETNINIKYKGEQQVQVGFYNKAQGTKFNVEPRIRSCKTAAGNSVALASLPTLSTDSLDSVEPSGAGGWNAILKLPNIEAANAPTGIDQEFTGALTSGQYVCKISVYGTDAIGTEVPTDVSALLPLQSEQFYLMVVS